MKWLYGALGALLLNASHAAADPTGGKPADEGKSVREIVETGNYRIEVQTALPRRGNNIQLSSKKGRLEIRFRARSSEDVMDYRITLFDNGSASVGVTMQKRQGIDFIGQLAE